MHVGALERRRQQLHFVAQLRDFLKDPAVGTQGVRHDRSMKFLGAKPRLTPAEKDNGGGTARNQLISEHAQDARTHQRIDILPGHIAGLLLHDPKTRIAIRRANVGFFKRTQHVDFTGQFGRFRFESRRAFDGNEINRHGQVEMVEAVQQRAQIGRDRALRSQLVQHVGLHFDKLNDGVAAEAAPIQHQRGVVDRWRGHRHRHLIPLLNDLAPMAQAHELVEALDRLVFGLEPAVPIPAGILVEGGLGKIAAQAIIDLPGDELGMAAQSFRHVLDNPLGMIPKNVAVKANGTARAFVFSETTLVDRQDLWMFSREPNWWRSGWGG